MSIKPSRISAIKLCDVCGKEDGFENKVLQTCASCGVSVHEICYGLENTVEGKKYPRWECFACKAVGMEMTVSKPGRTHRSILCSSRPFECALCPHGYGTTKIDTKVVDTGHHAMNLLYDTHGEEGIPKILPPNKKKGLPERVAWVHTLCALFIGKHEGVVFGCQKDGSYEGQDADSTDSADEASVENEFDYTDPDDDNQSLYPSIHHFVVTDVGKDGNEDCWSRRVRLMKEAKLKCYICGVANSMKKDTFAIQCCYKDCAQSYHVGCAKWGKNAEQAERIIFNPGAFDESGEELSEAVAKGYCHIHSKTKTEIKKSETRKTETIVQTTGLKSGKRRRLMKHPSVLKKQKEKAAKYSKLMQKVKAVIKEAKYAGKDIRKAVKRRKTDWKDNGGLQKTEFDTFWSDVSKYVGQEESDNEGNDVVTIEDGDAPSGNKWSHLWVPNYRPPETSFYQWDVIKEISQDDVELD